MYKKTSRIVIGSFIGMVTPMSFVFAAPKTFQSFVNQIINLFNIGTVLLFSIAILAFFLSVARNLYGYDSENSEKKKKLRQAISWGILTLFVMVSIWGIIAILQSTLKVNL